MAFQQPCGDARLDAAACERAVAVVAPHGLGVFSGAPPRPPMRQKQVQVAVLIVVEECRGNGAIGVQNQPRILGNVDKGSVRFVQPVLEQEDGAVDCSDEEIEVAVGVDVAERGSAAPIRDGQSDRGGRLHERAVPPVGIQVIGFGIAADQQQVDIAVAVVIRSRYAAARQLEIVAGFAAENAPKTRIQIAREDDSGIGGRRGKNGLDGRGGSAAVAAASSPAARRQGENDQDRRAPHESAGALRPNQTRPRTGPRIGQLGRLLPFRLRPTDSSAAERQTGALP